VTGQLGFGGRTSGGLPGSGSYDPEDPKGAIGSLGKTLSLRIWIGHWMQRHDWLSLDDVRAQKFGGIWPA